MEFNDKCVSVRIDPTGTPGIECGQDPKGSGFHTGKDTGSA